ncbi:PilZ domain-containing protein [Undibacterium sp. TS12]|uniref:PilZ domain-containing protein n=1 Tax=Undibacterium sp. TS12 TaxID=2908202 RepID=UPI001F4D23AE|nr:PilZ domain-containing protein [Undibacterium sp. TS12]MCH8622105.1 PilZ domain-containing protein [Undibacterium sp. TS12]
MIELRRSPRITVTWRAGVKLPDGSLVIAKIINVSAEGVFLQTSANLIPQRAYPMMIEIPGIVQEAEIYKVSCKGTVKHATLSGDSYNVGMQLSDMSELHAQLVIAWVSKTAHLN